MFEGSGEIILPNGEIAATATGKYMKMPLEMISDKNFSESEWIKEDLDLEFIEI